MGIFNIKESIKSHSESLSGSTNKSASSGKNNNEPKPINVNQYDITVDVSGLKFSSLDNATRIEYKEVSDYWRANFPTRTLVVHVPYGSVQKILCSQNKADMNGIKVYDLNLLVVPKASSAFKNKAFNDGSFKAILQQNDTDNDFMDSVNEDSRFLEMEQGQPRVPLTFILYRENELKYSQNFKINAVMPNPKLSDIFMWALNKSNPTLKCCCSKFESNPSMGLMVIPSRSFPDLINMMDLEVGFFKTQPIQFIDHNVFFFLNRENNANVTNEKLSYTLTVDVSRNSDKSSPRYVKKLDDQNYQMSISSSDIRISVSNSNSFGNSKKWIFPNGTTITQENSFSRNVDTIKKLTNVQPVLKLQSPVYEFADINLADNSLNFITPLTTIKIMDAMGKPRVYRIAKSELSVVSGFTSSVVVRGFRIITE